MNGKTVIHFFKSGDIRKGIEPFWYSAGFGYPSYDKCLFAAWGTGRDSWVKWSVFNCGVSTWQHVVWVTSCPVTIRIGCYLSLSVRT